jgi:hypothetical protein
VSGKYSLCTETLYETPPGLNSKQNERRTSNIQHRTSNIVTLRFIYFKTSEPQNIEYRTAECRREEEKRISNIECRIMNVEGRNSVYFIKKDRAQRYHPSKFCGSLFCGSLFPASAVLRSCLQRDLLFNISTSHPLTKKHSTVRPIIGDKLWHTKT